MKIKVIPLKDRAIMKVIACIDSSKTYEHIYGCKRMINLLELNYGIRKSTLTYVMLKYRHKHKEIHHG